MIHYIEIENFFSLKEKQIVDFRAKPSVFDPNPILPTRSNLKSASPPVIGFFGANASGKTTVLRAVLSIVSLLRLSTRTELPSLAMLFQPFKSQDCWNKNSKITIVLDGAFFEDGNIEKPFDATLKYSIEISNSNKNFLSKSIMSEELSYSRNGKQFKELFKRNEQNFFFSKEFSYGLVPLVEKTISKETAVLGRLSIFNHEISEYLMRLTAGIYSNFDGFNPTVTAIDDMINYFSQNKEKMDALNNVLPKFDLGIEEFNIRRIDGKDYPVLKHLGLDIELSLYEESRGTQTFVELFPNIIEVLETGGIAIIDELDNELHPLLIPEIFSWFYDNQKNPHKAQLFFTAHNAAIMNSLNTNQVYFTSKPLGEGTKVYCAKDIEGVRPDVNLMKKYLSGELGGIPIVG